ncbi:MAG: hypothetical protein J5486_08070 [Bacteroidaceae bacterium]|nr:hypothetical protein [Bacteroidaceae bacterium]
MKVQPASLDELCELFKTSEGRTATVKLFRENLPDCSPGRAPLFVDHLPLVMPGYRMERRRPKQPKVSLMSIDTNKSYNAVYQGLALLRVRGVASESMLSQLKDEAMTIPSTVLAITGSSNTSLKIIVAGTLGDGSLPTEPDTVERFHQALAERASKLYTALLSVELENKPCTPLDVMRWTYDPDLRYRPQATPLVISQIEYHTGHTTETVRHTVYAGTEPSLENCSMYTRRYSTAIQQVRQTLMQQSDEVTDEDMLGLVAKECVKLDIPEEEAVHQSTEKWRWQQLSRVHIRAIVESVYAESKPIRQHKKSSMQDLTLRLQQFMTSRYDLRFNELTNGVEYRPNRAAAFHFQPVDNRVANTMIQEANEAGLEIMDRDMKRYLGSTRIRDYNAAKAYLWAHNDDWDGVTDHIGALARRVPTSNQNWPDWFHTWFLGMVAQWLNWDRNHGNAIVPLLIGPQGCGKSTFGQLLLPRELRSEGYRELVNFGNKDDVQRSLTSSLLINLDEFNQISDKLQQGFLKNLVQKTSFKGRRPYGSVQVELPRRASFIATSNFADVLNDPSGSRRFLVAMIEGSDMIDTTTPISYGPLYSQAYRELKSGRPYFFSPNEQAQMEAYNASCADTPPETLHFNEVFRPVTTLTDSTLRLTLSQIIMEITRQTKYHYDNAARIRLARHLASEVRKLRLRKTMSAGYSVFFLERIK